MARATWKMYIGPSNLKNKFFSEFGEIGGGGGNQLLTFDAESKSAKISNSLYGGEGGGW